MCKQQSRLAFASQPSVRPSSSAFTWPGVWLPRRNWPRQTEYVYSQNSYSTYLSALPHTGSNWLFWQFPLDCVCFAWITTFTFFSREFVLFGWVYLLDGKCSYRRIQKSHVSEGDLIVSTHPPPGGSVSSGKLQSYATKLQDISCQLPNGAYIGTSFPERHDSINVFF